MSEYYDKIATYRQEIDKIDQELIRLFKTRFDIVKKVGDLKKEYDMSPLDENRWRQIVENLRKTSEEQGLNPYFVDRVWGQIHNESLRLEE